MRADKDVIEQLDHRQAIGDHVTKLGLNKHRLGFDTERVEGPQQQRRLGLAVAEAPRPGLFREGRNVAALAHDQSDVADAVLDKRQRLCRACLWIASRGSDLLHFVVERACSGNCGRIAKQWKHQVCDVVPGGKVGRLREPTDPEPGRRTFGRHQRLDVLS